MHIAYMRSAPRGVGLLMARVSGERSVQLEYVGIGYGDPSASVLPGRSEMVETMAGKVLWTKPVLQSSLTVGKSLHFQVLVRETLLLYISPDQPPSPLERME